MKRQQQPSKWNGQISEHDRIRLRGDIATGGETLRHGSEGTVVSVYRNGEGYAVEFQKGRSVPVVVTLYPDQLEPLS